MLGAAFQTFLGQSANTSGVSSIVYRTDAHAANVRLAVPFDSVNTFNDVSHEIRGIGTAAPLTQGPASSISGDNVYWTSTPDYGTALLNASGLGSALTYTMDTAIPSAASGTYVVEGWARAASATTNANWCLSSGDDGGRWLFAFNSGTTNQSAPENWLGLGDTNWHHFAIVCAGGTKRAYVDGIYKMAWTSSNSGFSTLHVGQFNSGDNNDFNGNLQDLRVTLNTTRGYTGTNTGSANFALPSSIVESF